MNIKHSNPLINNILSLVLGQGGNLLINFVSISLTARYLGVNNFGNFNYLLAIVTVTSKLIDLGLSQIVFREVSKSNNYSILHTAISIRIILYLITLFLFNVIILSLNFSYTEIFIINILFLNILISSKFQNFRELFDIPFKVSLKMSYSALMTNLDNLIYLALIMILPVFNGGLLYVVIAYVISNFPGFFLILYFNKKRFNYFPRFLLINWNFLLKESLPLFGYILLLAIYQQADILLLKTLINPHDTGIYAAAIRLTLPFGIIPFALITTVFPLIVRKSYTANVDDPISNRAEINSIVFKVLYLISFSIAAVCSFKASQIVSFIFGLEYKESAIPMIILFWSQIFLYFNFFTSDLITIKGRQIYNLIYALLIVSVNITLILILIPHFSYFGVSVSKLLATFCGFVYLLFITKKEAIKFKLINLNTISWSVIVVCGLMILSNLPLLPYLIISILVILAITILTKFFNLNEIILITKSIDKKRWSEIIAKIY